MQHPFDQLAKMLGKAALGPSGPTIVQYEITRDAQYADLRHEPDPACAAERARLGLLGRMAEVLCLIEVFGHAPTGEELRACIGKHFAHGEEHAAARRAQNRRRSRKGLAPEPLVEPRLWIIAPTISAPILRKIGAKAAASFPPGVFCVGADVFRVGIVVASELPPDRSTLLVRLMAAGPGLASAVGELAALPADAHERTVAQRILLRLQSRLFRKPRRTREEEEFIVAMQSTWEEARALGRDEGLALGRDEGLAVGRAQGEANALLTVLRGRCIPVPDSDRERILAERDPTRIERWIEKAILATSLADVLDEPS
jgi:hypothetical protein